MTDSQKGLPTRFATPDRLCPLSALPSSFRLHLHELVEERRQAPRLRQQLVAPDPEKPQGERRVVEAGVVLEAIRKYWSCRKAG